MKTVSNEFKTQINELANYSDGKVVISDGITPLTFDSNMLSKIELSASSKVNDTNVGVIAPYTITVELLGDQTQLLDLKTEKLVKPFIGIKVGSAFEYVEYQNFIITEVKYNDTTNVTKIYGVDYTYKLNKEFVDANVYPMSLYDYLNSVLDYAGLTLLNESILNGDFIIETQPFSELTNCNDIVKSIAELALSFVSTTVDDKIIFHNSFQTFDDLSSTYDFLSQYTYDELSSYTYDELATLMQEAMITELSKDAYWNLKLQEDNYKSLGVNTMTLKISQVEGENNSRVNEDSVAIDGTVEVAISDNQIVVDEAKRLQVIDFMFDKVNGYKNTPFTLEYTGFPFLELNDVVKIEKMDGSFIQPCVDEIYLLYNGGLKGRLKTYSLTPTDTKYKNKGNLTQRVRRAEILVDKTNGTINAVAQEVDDLEGRVSSTEFELSPEQFSVSVGTVITDKYGQTIENVQKNFIFNEDGFEINSSQNNFVMKVDETELSFYDGATKMASINNLEFNITRGRVIESMIIGVHKIEKYNTNITVFRYIGE